MTEREIELHGYIGELLVLARGEARWAKGREVLERIADATAEDRAALRASKLHALGWRRHGDTWSRGNDTIVQAH